MVYCTSIVQNFPPSPLPSFFSVHLGPYIEASVCCDARRVVQIYKEEERKKNSKSRLVERREEKASVMIIVRVGVEGGNEVVVTRSPVMRKNW